MSVITPHDPFEVARRIHGEGSGVGQRGKRAFVALTRTNRGRIGLALLTLSAMVGLSFGSLGLAIGLRTGNGEAVQGVFPLLFVLLFLSSGALPRNLIENDWFQTIATINPVSYLIEGFRSLFISGWDGEALALAFGVSIVILALGIWAATAALRTRIERT